MKHILTYEEAQQICDRYHHFNFSERTFRIDGFKISTFDYFICGFNDFNNPLNNDSGIDAFDMRGVTFVFDENNNIWKRFLMLPKFFNINQTDHTQYDVVKGKKIKHISIKEDGSLVAFMMLPNGNIFSKTISGFDNEMCINSMAILNRDKNHIEWIKTELNNGFTPMFEYVSYDNRIVLKYSTMELRFIGKRNNKDGNFVPASLCDVAEGINKVTDIQASLDDLIERSNTEENKEGWVVMFDDGMLLKIKTKWYFNVHHLRTENIVREDYVISNYYNQTLDDIISQLDPIVDSDVLGFVGDVTRAIDSYSLHIDEEINKLVFKLNNEFKGDWRSFAISCYKEAWFGFVKAFLKDTDEYNKEKVRFILKQTYRLKNARQIVDKWKGDYERKS